MKKLSFGVISILMWIAFTSILIFNNSFQLYGTLSENINLLKGFIIIVLGVTIYGIKNRKNLKW